MSKYNIVDRTKFIFYQIPKLLIHGEKYKKELTHSEIIAYSILMDRLNVSIKNNWFDEKGNIYFVYSNPQLVEILGVSRPTVNAIKKKLTKLGLLEEERTGRGNRLYLLEPIPTIDEAKYIINLDKEKIEDKSKFTEKEIEKVSKNLKQNTEKNAEDSKKFTFFEEKASQQVLLKNTTPKIVKNLPSDSKKFTPSNKNLKRTKDFKDNKESDKTDKIDTNLISNAFNSKDNNKETESLVIEGYIKERELNFLYGSKLVKRMEIFSFNEFDTFKTFVNKIEFAQKSVEKEYNITLPIYEGSHYFDFMEEQLLKTFNRAIQQQRNGKVENIASYLFISFKSDFMDLAETIKGSAVNTTI